jgi:hypothetical protein
LAQTSSRTISLSAADWPDWSGRSAIVVGTGPGAKAVRLERGSHAWIAVNDSWEIAPWADVLYACDKDWWIRNRGVPDFSGMKVTASPTASRVYSLNLVRLVARAQVLLGEPGRIGCGIDSGGGHSGFQAINLASQFGSRRIGLVGFDMTTANGIHWHRRKMDRTYSERIMRWRTAMDGAAASIARLGIEVVNLTPGSALRNYRFMTVEEFSSWPA